MEACKWCGKKHQMSPEQRERIRAFKHQYPWVFQKDLATLFGVTQMRISEIIRSDERRGGK